MLTIARLHELLVYDPETGVFRWRTRQGRAAQGSLAGCKSNKGYVAISIDGKKYYAHRLAWFYVYEEWPSGDIDHKDGVRGHSRLAVLRRATRTQNMQNMKRHHDNTSGFKGVTWDSERRKWRATIQINGKWKQIGRFNAPEEAHAAYLNKARQHFGEFARAA